MTQPRPVWDENARANYGKSIGGIHLISPSNYHRSTIIWEGSYGEQGVSRGYVGKG